MSQCRLYGCNYSQLDRATNIEHNPRYVLGLAILPRCPELIPVPAFSVHVWASFWNQDFQNQGSILGKNNWSVP